MAYILKSTTLAYATQYYTFVINHSKAVVQRCFVKKVFLKISINSQENPCARDFFNKVAGLKPTILLKQRLAQVFFSEFCENSKNTFYYRTPLVTASD